MPAAAAVLDTSAPPTSAEPPGFISIHADRVAFRTSLAVGFILGCSLLAWVRDDARVAFLAISGYGLARLVEVKVIGARFWLSTCAFLATMGLILADALVEPKWDRLATVGVALVLAAGLRVGRRRHATAFVVPTALAIAFEPFESTGVWEVVVDSVCVAGPFLYCMGSTWAFRRSIESLEKALGMRHEFDSGLPVLPDDVRLGYRRDPGPKVRLSSLCTSPYDGPQEGRVVVRRASCESCRALQPDGALESAFTVGGTELVVAYESWGPLVAALEGRALSEPLRSVFAAEHSFVVIEGGEVHVEATGVERFGSEWVALLIFARAITELGRRDAQGPYR